VAVTLEYFSRLGVSIACSVSWYMLQRPTQCVQSTVGGL